MKHGDQMWRLQETHLFIYLIILVEYYMSLAKLELPIPAAFFWFRHLSSPLSPHLKKNALSMIPGMSKISRRY